MSPSRESAVRHRIPGAHLSVRVRLTLWYTALLAGGLLLFSATVYLLMSHSLQSNLDISLHQRVNQIVPTVDVTNSRVRLPSPGEEPDAPFIPVQLLTRSGQPVGGLPPAPVRSWLAQHGSSLPHGFATGGAGDVRFATAPVENNNRRVGYILVWQSTRSIDQARQSLLLLMLGAGPVLLLLAGLGGMLLARRALSPVAQITETASSISATDLHRRVPIGPTHDELNKLATTFNAMIERLEAAVERERRFTADASHELRSPLSVILAESSLALEQPLEPEEYLRALGIIYDQAHGMQDLIAALLTLARVEVLRVRREIVRVADLVDRAARQCAVSAQGREVTITSRVAPGVLVEGDVTLLTRAVRNVLDNAVKASPPSGVVTVTAADVGNSVLIDIQDEGPGIAPAYWEKVFEPFYQVEEARTPGDSHGLGLAICRRIVEAHGGTVSVLPSSGQGARFGITLPTAEGSGDASVTLSSSIGDMVKS